MGGSKNVHILQMFSTYNLQRSFEDSSSEEFVLGVVPGRRRWQKLMTKRKSKKKLHRARVFKCPPIAVHRFRAKGEGGVKKSKHFCGHHMCIAPQSVSDRGAETGSMLSTSTPPPSSPWPARPLDIRSLSLREHTYHMCYAQRESRCIGEEVSSSIFSSKSQPKSLKVITFPIKDTKVQFCSIVYETSETVPS